MIANLVLLSGVGLISTAFIFRRKQQYFKAFFDDVQRSQKYHLDYIDELGKLPINKSIIVFGIPKSNQIKQKELCKTIIKKQSEQQEKEDEKKQYTLPKVDRLWKFSLKNPFFMQTLSNQQIIIEQDKNEQLYAFNLLRKNHNEKYEERVIVKGQPICVYGQLVKRQEKFIMKSRLMMGVKNQNFLSYLDDQIMRINKKNKYLTIAGTSILASHFLYTYFKSSSKGIVIQQKRKKTSEQEIKQEIQNQKQQSKK